MGPKVERRNGAQTNIVLVTGSLQGGGAERVLSGMANFWAEKGWAVTFATWTGPPSTDFYTLDPAVQRVWLDDHAANDSILLRFRLTLLRILRFRKLLRDLNPDIVLSFITTSNVLTLISTVGLQIRIIVSERNNPACSTRISWLYKILRKALYVQADAVVAQTHDVAQWIQKTCRVKVDVIPNPLRPLPDTFDEREHLILAVGRLTRQKGFDLLLQSFARIQGDFGDWKVLIVGSGPERATLQDLCDSLNLAGRIEFMQPVKGIESLMSRAALVVQPSRFEGFPNVVLESMGMGAAVISTDCPWGPSELIRDGVNGRLVPVDDVDSLARAMAELIEQPELRRRLGQEARRVREDYRQEKIMAEWERCVLRRTPA